MKWFCYIVFKWLKNNFWLVHYKKMRSKYNVASNFRFNGENILLYGLGEINIGPDSYLGSNSSIQASKGYIISIGRNCRISHNVRIYTNTYLADQDFSSKILKEEKNSVKIGNHVWIGANVIILPGVVIHDNVIVGANSLVNKSIEANTIVGGVPIKILRKKKNEIE